MGYVRKEIRVDTNPAQAWAAVRDVGAIHRRLARGFVTDTRLEGDVRTVTFKGGVVVRERIVDVNDVERRLAYSVVEWQTTHHNASIQVYPDGPDHSRIVWIADLLPDELTQLVGQLMDQGCAAIKATLENRPA
jgi:hypothetical protein